MASIFVAFFILSLGYSAYLYRASKRTEKALRHAKETAEQAAEVKAQFLANMSHEIRTPMNGIIGLTDILIDSTQDPQQLQNLEMLKRSELSLLSLLNDILDFSKLEAGRMVFESISFDLRELIRDTLSLLHLSAHAKGLGFYQDVQSNVPLYLLGDPLRVRQILTNLIGNAVKFTEKGTVGIEATLLHQIDGKQWVQISVRDTGIGISHKNIQTLFQSFQQADASINRRFGGSGLGLAITARLVQQMGGRVAVESILGEGSCFQVLLPFEKAENTSPQNVHPLRSLTNQHIPRLRILVAEDHAVNQHVATILLKKLGQQVTCVENGALAVQARETDNYDLILMDSQMPVLDGLEATRQIRKWESVKHQKPISIIAMTASTLEKDRELCLNAGMDDYLTKPVDKLSLIGCLERVALKVSFNKAA